MPRPGLVALSLAATALAGGAHANDTAPAARPPLVIAEQGNFFVGGSEVRTEAGTKLIDTMYVQYQIPAERKHPYPIVFIHGGASTGWGWWSTPDGREGWATRFLRKGYAVYVVDLPTMGRSPYYEPEDGAMVPAGAGSLEPRLTRPQDHLQWPQARHFSRFPGTGKPGDPAYEQLRSSSQASIETPFQLGDEGVAIKARQDRIGREAGAALLDRIGPAILVTHSRSGVIGWQIADARPDLVKGIVAAEPNGPPFYNTSLMDKDEVVARPWGISYGPLTFSPPVTKAEDFGPLELQPQEAAELERCWMPRGAKRSLTNVAKVPVVVISGQASYHAGYDHCTVNFLRWAGVRVDFERLEKRGITGNGHLLITETNNAEIADLADNWLRANVAP